MIEVSDKNFGILIAYLLPGFAALPSLSRHSSTLAVWLVSATGDSPSVGGFLFAVLTALAVGLVVSAIRWLALDSLHARTGVVRPNWDFTVFQRNFVAFEGAVENHYRYYQFYGNTLIALLLTAVLDRPFAGLMSANNWATWGLLVVTAIVLFAASRDALSKYYRITGVLLSS